MLWHLVIELHLDQMSDFLTLISHDHLGDLLVSHVSRPVNFDAQCFDVVQLALVGKLEARPYHREVTSNIFENAKALNDVLGLELLRIGLLLHHVWEVTKLLVTAESFV